MLSWVVALSLAQELPSGGLDAHALSLAPQQGAPLDYVWVWRPSPQEPLTIHLQALVEFADKPLVVVRENGAPAQLLDDLFTLNLGVAFAPHTRVSVQLALPVVLRSVGAAGPEGATLADLRLSVPVLLLDPEVARGVGISVVPFLDAPTGSTRRFLGNGAAGGGATLAVGFRGGGASVDGNLGFHQTPQRQVANLSGGSRLMAAVGVGYAPVEWLGVRLEAVVSSGLAGAVVPGTDTPAEALASLRGWHPHGLSWTVGASSALSPGVGAASYRIFAGIGWTSSRRPKDSDGDDLMDPSDPCPSEAEVVNGWQDEDGCPDTLTTWRLRVVDAEGQPVPYARVSWDGFVGSVGVDGLMVQQNVMPGTVRSGRVDADGWAGATFDSGALGEGPVVTRVQLGWVPGVLRVEVRAASGELVPAKLSFSGPVMQNPIPLPTGRVDLILPPGAWTIAVESSGLGSRSRVVAIPEKPGRTEVRFDLIEARIELTDEEIVLLQPVELAADGASPTPDSEAVLEQVAALLIGRADLRLVQVRGYAVEPAGLAVQQELSQRYAEAVKRWLQERGVDGDRLHAVGMGPAVPLAADDAAGGHAWNRRVQFVIVDRGMSGD